MVAPAEQRRVFVRPPRGVRKVVLATNIAETAITIDDVTCVINAGRLKEKSYDPYTEVSTLQGAWVSKASERQRRGRAGRCQPGSAFHLYSRTRSEALADFQLPEIKRSPLDEMGLQVKLLEGPGRALAIADFLGKAVEPPVQQAVTAAVQLLEDIGALDECERLTSLGRHLAALPLPPAVGKMLLYGALFRVLDPVLTVACCMAYRDPWVLPTQSDARRAAAMLRAGLSSEAGGSSDHLATVKAYNGWKAARAVRWGGWVLFYVRQRGGSSAPSPACRVLPGRVRVAPSPRPATSQPAVLPPFFPSAPSPPLRSAARTAATALTTT